MKYKVAIVFIIAVIATLLWGVGADTICNANHEKGSLSAFTPVPAYNITRTKCNKKKCTVYCSEHYHPAKHPNSYRKSVGALCKLTDDGVVTWDLVDTCVPKKCYANKENASLIAAAPAYNRTLTICDEDFCTLFCGTGYRRSGSNDPDYRFVGASCERIDGQINWKFRDTCTKKKCNAKKENTSLIAAAPAYNSTLTICDENSCTIFCSPGYHASNHPDYRFVGASCERIDGQINWKFVDICTKIVVHPIEPTIDEVNDKGSGDGDQIGPDVDQEEIGVPLTCSDPA
eukprot:854557_1